MAIEVVGLSDGQPVRGRWQIVAYHGDGPFIPAVPARAIIRKCVSVRPGARPCLFELSISEIENALMGLSVQTNTFRTQAPPLFQNALGDRWRELPSSVQRLHSVHDIEVFTGKARVTRGEGLIERAAAFVHFPRAGENVPVTITKTRTALGEIWSGTLAAGNSGPI
jgi:Domain of unknown function (DUF4166)